MASLMIRRLPGLLILAPLLLTMGCNRIYYDTMEKFGVEKRDILVDRVQDARDEQEDAKEQFKSALDRFTEVINFEGGDLESKYRKLDSEYRRSMSDAQAVRDRIDAVENVAAALFREWEAELDEYANASLRRSSEQKLQSTQIQYDRLITAMHKAESRMDPVLEAFQDQVLFLKHNLNAKAIASLEDELVSVETDVGRLIREMEASIAEADQFIRSMGNN
jgi:hypothetical protein